MAGRSATGAEHRVGPREGWAGSLKANLSAMAGVRGVTWPGALLAQRLDVVGLVEGRSKLADHDAYSRP